MKPLNLILLAALLARPLAADVFINELSATQSDRLLVRETGKYPRVGTTLGWQISSFDDSLWKTGSGPFGFGVSGETYGTNTALEMLNRTPGLYLRKKFTASSANAASATDLQLSVKYNDGFIAYLNGIEIARRNLGNPGMFAYRDQLTFNAQDTLGDETITIGAANAHLIDGENTLSIQVHNSSVSDSSLLLDADLLLQSGATLVNGSTDWKYFCGFAEPSGGLVDYGLLSKEVGNQLLIAWAQPSYNDSSWTLGTGPVGVETDNPPDYALGTNLATEMRNITPSVYIRNQFTVDATEAASAQPLSLNVDYDDGIIVFINGTEVFRRGLGATGTVVPYNTLAPSHGANGDNGNTTAVRDETVTLASAQSLLTAGENIVAIQLHNTSLNSTDAIARVTLSSTGGSSRVLVDPSDPVRYFVGVSEPIVESDGNEEYAIAELPDSENDWIELKNTGSTEVPLAGWSLSDDLNEPRKWSFPPEASIPANGYLTVIASGLDLTPANDGTSYAHTNFKLSSSGETLILTRPDDGIEDQIASDYPPQNWRYSYGRQANGAFGFLEIATPGTANDGIALNSAPDAPQFSIQGGFYPSSISVSLSSPAGTTIRYSLDGSDPLNGTLYSGAINVASNTIIRARSFGTDSTPSATITQTYLINQSAARQGLAAICLGGDPRLTFYGPNTNGGPADGEGIFSIKGGTYSGNNWNSDGDTSAFQTPAIRGRALEKPATLEFLPLAGSPLRSELGLRISGSSYSRPRYRLTDAATDMFTATQATQKPSFNMYFRSEFGDRPVDYPFFPENSVTKFEDIRIRAGKNDISNPFIKDELLRRIFAATGQEGSVGSFNTLWINGVYKGYYNMTEHLREAFMQQHHGGEEDWDIQQGGQINRQQVNDFPSGDPLHFNEMMAYLRTADLSSNSGYEGVHDYLDIDNYIDYILVNAYSAMGDWPNNNWVASRERSPNGRWRFYMWDAEGGFGNRSISSYNTFTSDLTLSNSDAQNTAVEVIPAIYTLLKDSPHFQLRFADRAQKHFFNDGALMNANMTTIFTQLKNEINPIMQDTIGSTVNESFHNNWIVSATRRTTLFSQMTDLGLWTSKEAPTANQHGGSIPSGFSMILTTGSGDAIYYTTDDSDPRAIDNSPTGNLYGSPVPISTKTRIRARAYLNGNWSPEIDFTYTPPFNQPTFLPTDSGDWANNSNWSTNPATYPNAENISVTIPGASDSSRNVELGVPITVGKLTFEQGTTEFRNRLRDKDTGNSLTFSNSPSPAELIVTGTGTGYVELENEAGTTLASTLKLDIRNALGDSSYGALRLRETWSGPGGLIKTGIGMASLTGSNKTFTGATLIEEGVLNISQPSSLTASTSVSVLPGGQLRLSSGNSLGEPPRIYSFGGTLSLSGSGRGTEIPDEQNLGKLGALRYESSTSGSHAIISTPVQLTGTSNIHVADSENLLELTSPLSGDFPLSKSGGGTLLLGGDHNSRTTPIMVDTGSLEIAGALGSPVSIATGTILRGYGSTAAITGDGSVLLPQTRMDAPSSTAPNYAFVFGQTDLPTFDSPDSSGNSALILDSEPAGVLTLDLYLTDSNPANGSIYKGGIFTPISENLANSISTATTRVFIPDAGGATSFEGTTWSPLTSWTLTTTSVSLPSAAPYTEARVLELRIGSSSPIEFATWQTSNFSNPSDLSNPAISGPLATPFGDGVSNLLRYAFGVPDGVQASPYLPSFTSSGLNFPFDSGRHDLKVTVESTDDPTNWVNPFILFDSATDLPPTPDEQGRITISDTRPDTVRRFYRVRVEHN